MTMAARALLPLVLVGLLAAGVTADTYDLGNRPPNPAQKVPSTHGQIPTRLRQGGDTIATATPITSVPYQGSGTTAGFANDYDSVCPTAGSDSPDVVYSFTRPQYGTLTIDLCGSDYDTKIYVMSEEGQIFDCNDDHYFDAACGWSTSRIDNLWLPPGQTYYLVIDGAGGASGQYEFEIRRWDEDPPNPAGEGDTIANAIVIPHIPFDGTGTTVGFVDDYDEICPYSGSTAPDVVYEYVSPSTQSVNIDLCGSAYDTKMYVYDAGLNLIACNDDFYFGAPCGTYVSKLENVPFVAGTTYYIIIDGYGSASGAYVLSIAAFVPCVISCPAGGVAEGEPALVPEYVDNYNGGCNTPTFPFQVLSSSDNFGRLTLCGVSGWYLNAGGNLRDTDWYILFSGGQGAIEITADAEYATYIFELGPQDCSAIGVLQQATVGPCAEGFMTIPGYSYGAPVWFWAGPTVFAAPGADTSYDYVVWFSGLEAMVTTEAATWSRLKALYR
jgi:hypothetical protein